MVKSKKSQLAEKHMIEIIIAVAMFIILIIFMQGAFDIFKSGYSDEACRASVLSQQATMFGKTITSLKCPRKDIVVTNELAKEMYNTMDSDKKFIKKMDFKPKLLEDKTQIHALIADEMANCWYKMNEGRTNVFDNNFFASSKDSVLYGESRKPCLICSHISFEINTGKTEYFGASEELNNYLLSHNYTKQGLNIRYYEFLNKEYQDDYGFVFSYLFWKADSSIYIENLDKHNGINSYESYVVFFKADKVSKLGEKVDGAEDRYFIMFARPETMVKVCNIIVN